jgi:hypothetical protein
MLRLSWPGQARRSALLLICSYQARRDAEQAAMRSQAEAELRANGAKPDEAERERRGIEELCRALNVTMREVRRVRAVRWPC